MTPPNENPSSNELETAVDRLNTQLKMVNKSLHVTYPRMLFRSLLNGVAFGLGSFLGATLFVSMLIYSLSSIDFIPIIGDWAAQVAERIQN